MENNDICDACERSIHKKFAQDIWGRFLAGIKKYNLIQKGDVIGVCISGGKDSFLMAKLFQELKKYQLFDFDVKFLCMDPGYNEPNRAQIEYNAKLLNIPITFYESDIFLAVSEQKSPCYLCARMRRGALYGFAQSQGCNKIALGHHFDDVIETILMSMLYSGQIQSMRPKLHSQNFEGMELIRPMYLVHECFIKAWVEHNGLKFLGCACKLTQDSAKDDTTSKRLATKKLINELSKNIPELRYHIFRCVENVDLDSIIEYKQGGVRHNFLDEY